MPKSSPEVPDWFKSDRVLVLLDDAELREVLVGSLNAASFAAQAALSPEDALERARKEKFQLAVAGRCPSWSPDALATLTTLKSRRAELCCLLVTLEPDEELARRSIELEANDYLWGPLEIALVPSAREALASNYDRKQLRKAMAPPLRLASPQETLMAEDVRSREDALTRLEVQRERALRGMFLAIRSQLVSKTGALYLWDLLDPLESAYEQATRTPIDATEIHAKAMAYEDVVDKMTCPNLDQSVASSGARTRWMVDKATFERFYDRVARGKITAEQMRLAPWLRRVSPRQRSDQPERESLYRAMWD